MDDTAPLTSFHPDILGEGFEAMNLRLGADPEEEGEAVATLVRYRGDVEGFSSRPAIVWVPGMSDYFFQDHVAKFFHAAGYAFYGLDLRKMGRARQPGQTWHYTADLRNYFPDLDAMVDVLAGQGHSQIIPMAHSTGGLVVPLWLNHLRRDNGRRFEKIAALVLNSPWLDLQYPAWLVRLLRPVVMVLGRRFPRFKIPGGNLGTYGKSIHADYHGEWHFDTQKKPLGGHNKYLGWLRAVLVSQRKIHRGKIDVSVPVLCLSSSRSLLGKPYSPAADGTDVVLDVDQIAHRAPQLGDNVRLQRIDGARHDVFLSLPHARQEALDKTLSWLDKQLHNS